MTDTPAPGRFRFTLSRQIVVGLVIGALLGWLVPEFAVSLKPASDLFLRLIRMVIGPLLFTTLVVGIAGAGGKMVGRLAVKAIVWFELATTVALAIGLAAGNLIQPGSGVSQAALAAAAAPTSAVTKSKTLIEFLVEAVPVSFIDAMTRNDVLQIVVFSVFFGLAVSAAGTKAKLIKELAEAGAETMFKLVGFVMRFAPFGVGAAIAVTLGKNGIVVLLPLLKLVGTLYGALIVFFLFLFAALRLLTRTHMPTFFAAIREPALIAFTTATSDAALPRALQILEGLGVPRRIVSFVVPAGYAFNLDGSTLYLSLALVFVAQAAHVELSWGQQISAMLLLMASSKGVAGVPRASLVVLTAALAAFNLPAEGVVLILGVDAIMDMGRTCVNVVGNCVATVIVAVWENAIPANAPIYHPRAAHLPEAQLMHAAEAAAVESVGTD
ncbi:MAG TPA: cation:dicarboxylase symporter family transporter [Kofleriaceae bacterium]|jgi:proton glutamate symport protein|nr:cation:dicarboxylase symporter family transporter [Kofleriaceae bacterium]